MLRVGAPLALYTPKGLFSAGELAGLPDVAFVGDEKFSEIYITLHLAMFKIHDLQFVFVEMQEWLQQLLGELN